MLENLALGLSVVCTWKSIFIILGGVFWGTIGGMIPGINATIAMALLLPLTWGMDPTIAIMLLCGVYCGGEYGGSIPAVLINTPGTNAATCTVLDGYPLHQQGKTGLALYTSLIASCFGGFLSAVVLIILVIPLAKAALAFGPAEYFALATVGLSLICSLGEKNVWKGILAGLLGILLSTVGFDPFVGTARFTFGIDALASGFEMIPLMMGLFAISEMFSQARGVTKDDAFVLQGESNTKFPGWQEIKSTIPYQFFGGIVGTIVGAMPGVGATTAAFLGYSEAKRWSKDSDSWGKGNLNGVAVPESANNGATGGALVPLLALGIPGSNSTAILLGAMMIHNVVPGPLLFSKTPEIPYSIFVAMLLANIIMFFVGWTCIKFAIKVTSISKPALLATIVALVFTGVYAYSNEVAELWIVLAFGLLGLAMRRFGLPHTATVLGFVLGFIMEANLRRGLIVSEGSYMGVFTNSTLSSIILVFAVLSVIITLVRNSRLAKPSAKTVA